MCAQQLVLHHTIIYRITLPYHMYRVCTVSYVVSDIRVHDIMSIIKPGGDHGRLCDCAVAMTAHTPSRLAAVSRGNGASQERHRCGTNEQSNAATTSNPGLYHDIHIKSTVNLVY